jgi:hypothetical protein
MIQQTQAVRLGSPIHFVIFIKEFTNLCVSGSNCLENRGVPSMIAHVHGFTRTVEQDLNDFSGFRFHCAMNRELSTVIRHLCELRAILQ